MKKSRLFLAVFLLAGSSVLSGCSSQPNPESTPSDISSPEEYNEELVIVGAGGAGLISGITALEAGQDVLIIEKMGFAGGATLLSEGYIAGGGSTFQKDKGITDDPETIYQDLMKGGKEQNQEDLAHLYAEGMGAAFDWLTDDLHVPFTEASPLSFPEHTHDRVMVVDGGGSQYVQILKAKYEELGGRILYDTKARELLTEDGKVTGVKAENKAGEEVVLHADVVLLATGGFGASPDLRPEGLEDVVFYGAVSSTGDGIKMAEAIGAQTIFMDTMKIYPQGLLNPQEEELTAEGALVRNGISCAIGSKQTTNTTGSIYVNLDGSRFINENTDFVSIKEAQLQQPEKKMFLVMDQAGYDAWYAYTSTVLSEELAEEWFQQEGQPVFVRADSLADAAKQAGLDPEKLAATVKHFNEMAAAGQDTDFGRELTGGIEGNTYYILELKLRTATTLGGVKTNDKMQVLNLNDEPIPGLYAAGEVVGGANGVESMPSCMNAWSLVSARQAANTIVEALKH